MKELQPRNIPSQPPISFFALELYPVNLSTSAVFNRRHPVTAHRISSLRCVINLPYSQKHFFKVSIHYVQLAHPALPATSAARCLIISITAALRRESDCCCSLLKCSFKSLHHYPGMCKHTAKPQRDFSLNGNQHEILNDGGTFENKPATWNMAFRFFARSGMQLKEIPHSLTEKTASRGTCFALYTKAENTLNLAAIRISKLWRTDSRSMKLKVKNITNLQKSTSQAFHYTS